MREADVSGAQGVLGEGGRSSSGATAYEPPAITPFGNVRDILEGANEGSIDDGVGGFKRGTEE